MKKILSLALALIMVMSLFNGVTVSAATVTASGSCGKNVTWMLDSDGLLTISGEGEMDNYQSLDSPWHNYLSFIELAVIESGVTSIGNYAFYDCYALTSVKISDTITNIGDNTFAYCDSLNSIGISDSVTSIGKNAFICCPSITEIYYTGIEEQWNKIAIGDGNEYFINATLYFESLLPSEIASGSCGEYTIWNLNSNGVLTIEGIGDMISFDHYSGTDAPWYNYSEFIKSVIVKDGVTNIGGHAFYGCRSLVSIDIPDTVEYLGWGAFEGCISLTSIKIPDGSGYIYDKTFSGCSSLISIEIPSGVRGIGIYAFSGCESLSSIKIPESVVNIDSCAFEYCPSLIDVYYSGTKNQWKNIHIGPYNWESKYPTIHFEKVFTKPTLIFEKDTLTLNKNSSESVKVGVAYIGDATFEVGTDNWNEFVAKGKKYTDINSSSGYILYDNTFESLVYNKRGNYVAFIKYTDDLNKTVSEYFAFWVGEPQVVFSGNIKTYGNVLKDTTIELLSEGALLNTANITGNVGTYTFEKLVAGSYTVRVSKTKHAPREYEVTVADADITQDVEIWLYGDVNGDGAVNAGDALQLNRKVANMSSVFNQTANADYKLKVANITAVSGTDTLLNSIDILHLNRKVANLSSIFDNIA